MITIATVACGLIALAYLLRVNWLRWGAQETTFVAQHILSGVACIYSAYSLWVNGWGVLEVVAPLMAALYLIRSRKSYQVATGHGDLSGPETHPLDTMHYRNVSGGRDS